MATETSSPEATQEYDSTIAWLLDSHVVAISIAIYVVAVTPLYFWIVGTIGFEGTIDGGVVMASLAMGSLMFVPAIMSYLRRKKFELGYGKGRKAMHHLPGVARATDSDETTYRGE